MRVVRADRRYGWKLVSLITVLFAGGCVSSDNDIPTAPRALTSPAQFVDKPSGISFQIPEGYALVRDQAPGRAEILGEYNFPVFQIVTSDSAYQYTQSGRYEHTAAGMTATIMLATNKWLAYLVSRTPSELKHKSQIGAYAVTVLEQTPTIFGNEIRTYVLTLPYGYGIAIGSANNVPVSADSVAHSLLTSVQS